MLNQIRLYKGDRFDPHYNLAVEQYLMETVPDGCCTLYLWQNKNTVVIGRNQNAWKECRTALLEEEGGVLARRLSGGGAVFHDLGNLNFTFLVPSEDYDLNRQLEVIIRACKALGIPAEKSGRNDILADGRKFSGNAFYHHNGRSYHHGTLMVDVDGDKMTRYLQPSKAKLQAKGVDSVRSRVVNLKELRPDLTIEMLKTELEKAFGEVCGFTPVEISTDSLDCDAIDAIYAHNASWEWNYGRNIPCTISCEQRFDWGELQLKLNVEGGMITSAEVFSDAMDWEFPAILKDALTGCRFSSDGVRNKIAACGIDHSDEIFRLVQKQMM